MTFAGEKKCRPMTCSRPLVSSAAISSMFRYEVLVARIAPGLAMRVEAGEHLLLDRHVLEHRLDDEVAVGEVVEGERAREQADALLDVRIGQPAALCARLVVPADDGEAAVERFLLVVSTIGDRACRRWRSSWRCRRPSCRRRRCRRCGSGSSACRPARPGSSRPGARRRRRSAAPRLCVPATSFRNVSRSTARPSSNGSVTRRLDAADAASGASKPRKRARIGRAEALEQLRAAATELLVEVAHRAQRPLPADNRSREGDRGFEQLALLRQRVDEARRRQPRAPARARPR